jgi:hypothetical protein
MYSCERSSTLSSRAIEAANATTLCRGWIPWLLGPDPEWAKAVVGRAIERVLMTRDRCRPDRSYVRRSFKSLVNPNGQDCLHAKYTPPIVSETSRCGEQVAANVLAGQPSLESQLSTRFRRSANVPHIYTAALRRWLAYGIAADSVPARTTGV